MLRSALAKISSFALVLSPSAVPDIPLISDLNLSNESLAVRRPIKPLQITKTISKGVTLRADIIYKETAAEVVVLAGQPLTKARLQNLVQADFHSVYPGTFHNRGVSFGDVVGSAVQNTNDTISKPFGWGTQCRVGKSVHDRHYFGVTTGGNYVIGRRSELRDDTGALIPAGASLSQYFGSFLGGLMHIDASDPKVRHAILESSKESTQIFIRLFNAENRNVNRKAAYEGLDGYRARPRSGIAICEDPSTGEDVLLLVCIGNGKSELSGATIKGFARQFFYIAEGQNLLVKSIAMSDGGGSVGYANRVGGLALANTPTPTGFGIRYKSQLIVKR